MSHQGKTGKRTRIPSNGSIPRRWLPRAILERVAVALLLLASLFTARAEPTSTTATTTTTTTATKRKILCLHGGGGTGEDFAAKSPGMHDLEAALPEFEFVYADAAYPEGDGFVWMPDPPGGKKDPTTDPGVSDASLQALDALPGPFAGLLGFSQGAAYVPVYLSRSEANLDFGVMFCGYPTLTHLGLLEGVEDASPFRLPVLIWMGEQDWWIPPALTRETIPFFESPVVVESPQGGHAVPTADDPTFAQVVEFVRGFAGDSTTTAAGAADGESSATPANHYSKSMMVACGWIWVGIMAISMG